MRSLQYSLLNMLQLFCLKLNMMTSVGVLGIVLFKMSTFGVVVMFYITTPHYGHCLFANQEYTSTLSQNEHTFLSPVILKHSFHVQPISESFEQAIIFFQPELLQPTTTLLTEAE